jgi:hypothetical protein
MDAKELMLRLHKVMPNCRVAVPNEVVPLFDGDGELIGWFDFAGDVKYHSEDGFAATRVYVRLNKEYEHKEKAERVLKEAGLI